MTAGIAQPEAPRLVLSEIADALFEAVPLGLVLTDESGVIRWADRWFGEVATGEPENVRGLPLSRCLIGAAPVLRSLQGRKKATGVVRLRRKNAPDKELHAQAVMAGPRAAGTVVWVLTDKAAAPSTSSPEPAIPAARRPATTHRANGFSRGAEGHLEALRLLHEFASSSSEEDSET